MKGLPETSGRGRVAETGLAFAAFSTLYAVWLVVVAEHPVPHADALRYIDYIVNLNQHGVFGLSGADPAAPPAPGRANAPVYMMVLAGISALDPGLADSFACLQTRPAGCTLQLNSLYIANAVLGGATIATGMAVMRQVTGSRFVQWAGGLFMLAFLIKLDFGPLVAPENALLLPFFLMCHALLKAVTGRSLWAFVLVGLALALTTLIRPSYLYLLYAMCTAFALYAAAQRDLFWGTAVGAMVAGFLVAVAPWAVRNFIHFDDFALSGGQYAEIIIAQRLAYHALGWQQAGVAFLHWLPDFGDKLAGAVGSERTLMLLGTGSGSVYQTSVPALYQANVERLGGTDGLLRHLITTHVVEQPFRFLVWTGLFAWRGLFVGKLLGLAGLVCTLVCIRHVLKLRVYSLLVLLAPMAFMVLFHGAISINIPRYNIFLILPYSLCVAWVLQECGALLAAGRAKARG